jgi:glycosyltransferase involved in cell wall biosynthesis
MNPRVSVVLPTYNRRGVLLEAIASARGQTFDDLEILVCDDGSSDHSREAVQALAAEDARIRWIEGGHSGFPGVNRNRGIRAARGEWIAFLDSDDLWRPRKLERQLAVLKAAPDAAFIYCYAQEQRPHRRPRRMTPFRVRREGRMFETLLFYSLIQTPTVLVRRELLARAGLFDEAQRLTIGEDYELFLRLAGLADFHFVPEDLVICRTQADSISADRLDGIAQVERVVSAAMERERVAPALAARVLARLDLRRYKQHLLRGAPKQTRVAQLQAALAKEPGNGIGRALLLAEKLGLAGPMRGLVRAVSS